jgi:non-ribosomal peptide synthetase component F
MFATRYYGLDSRDRVLQSSPTSFDISIEEIFPVLASGGVVVLRPNRLALGGRHFLEWLNRHKITVLDLPTAFWHEWTWEISGHDDPLPSSLRLVIVGGERAQVRALQAWRKRTRDRIRWVNTYGPTEASVIATFYEPRGLR